MRLSPEIGTYHNTLGVALYRLGQYREAVIELETSLAVSSRQDTPFDLFFLAMCQHHLGDDGRAKAPWNAPAASRPRTALPPKTTKSFRRSASKRRPSLAMCPSDRFSRALDDGGYERPGNHETRRRTPPPRESLHAVTMHVSAWFGRDERPPTSGVSPIRLEHRTHVRGWGLHRPNHGLTIHGHDGGIHRGMSKSLRSFHDAR